MKYCITLLLSILFAIKGIGQESLKISVKGVSQGIAEKLNANQDHLSWYTQKDGKTLVSNIQVELKNPEQKNGDRGRGAVKAEKNASGMYDFVAEVEVKRKKVDFTKPVAYEIVMETIMGNEVFATGTQTAEAFSTPITLDKYMWRAGNEKIEPKKSFCLSFSAFLEDANLRKQFIDNEQELKLNLADFALFLKQDAAENWKAYEGRIQGGITNGTSVDLSSEWPAGISSNKPLQVRFSAKTKLGNFIWGEYVVNPHEYRKEHRAQFYTAEAFNPSAKPITSNSNPQPTTTINEAPDPVVPAETKVVEVPKAVKEAESPQSDPSEKKYAEMIVVADQLFKEGKFKEAGEKYVEASKIRPSEEYPKKQKEICDSKLAPPSRQGTNPPKRPGTK